MKFKTTVALQFHLFAYLFTSTAISQSNPLHKKGCFHADILLLFPSLSHKLCGAEWFTSEVHLRDDFPGRWDFPHTDGEEGKAAALWNRGLRLYVHPSKGWESWVLLPQNPDTYPELTLSVEKAVPFFGQRCQRCFQLMP